MIVRTTVKSIQDIMRQDVGVDGDAQRISQLTWLFFLKIIDDQGPGTRNHAGRLPLADPRAASSGAPGRPTPRASPGRPCSISSTTTLFPALKGLQSHRQAWRPPPRRARRVRGRLQLHEIRPAAAAGGQQDRARSTSTTSIRAPALRRHLRTNPQRPAIGGQCGRVLHAPRRHRLHGR